MPLPTKTPIKDQLLPEEKVLLTQNYIIASTIPDRTKYSATVLIIGLGLMGAYIAWGIFTFDMHTYPKGSKEAFFFAMGYFLLLGIILTPFHLSNKPKQAVFALTNERLVFETTVPIQLNNILSVILISRGTALRILLKGRKHKIILADVQRNEAERIYALIKEKVAAK